MIPVILAGGFGTRLWPLSRTQFPKQFIALDGETTMLQQTVQRLGYVNDVFLICNEEHRFLAAEQLRQIDQQSSIYLEPVARNTAPAVALAAIDAVKRGQGEEPLLVLAADHVIESKEVFRNVIDRAIPLAVEGKLVTFGIEPQYPETGYGYIKAEVSEDQHTMAVTEFVEKPDLTTAECYLNQGGYYWNSGMFMFRADRYLKELSKYCPDILEACEQAMADAAEDMDFVRVDKEAFEACPDESIDYAVMEPLCSATGANGSENSGSVVVIPLDAGWSDVGSWSALWDIRSKDANHNVTDGDVILEDTRNSLVYGHDRLVTTLGVEDLVVVDTRDALLVASKNRVQDVKHIVSRINKMERNESFRHRVVFRPWGKYEAIDFGARHQVKRISVNPGARLSLQRHVHRAEHWVVVSGTARVRCGDEIKLLYEDQSTYIPIGEVHSLENPGEQILELIEIQSGGYLGEDDIVRFEDLYGRA